MVSGSWGQHVTEQVTNFSNLTAGNITLKDGADSTASGRSMVVRIESR